MVAYTTHDTSQITKNDFQMEIVFLLKLLRLWKTFHFLVFLLLPSVFVLVFHKELYSFPQIYLAPQWGNILYSNQVVSLLWK